MGRWVEERIDVPGLREEDNLSFELTLVLVKVGDSFHVEQNDFTAHQTLRAGAPGFGIGDERAEPRRKHIRGETLQRPATAKRSPGLKMRVLKAPFVKFVASILFSSLQVGRAGQAWAGDVGEVANHFHDLRVIQGHIANPVGRVEVYFPLGCGKASGEEKNGAQERSESSFARTSKMRARCFRHYQHSLHEDFQL